MKSITFIFLLSIGLSVQAQQSESEQVKNTIIDFFEAFHKQDTLALRSMVKGDINMQSIASYNEGNSVLTESSFGEFLKNIAGIPKDMTFEEKLLDFNIQIDGSMANAWVPYEFWYSGKMSHCGVNSFQLMKDDNKWKIIYLIDTRSRKNCKN